MSFMQQGQTCICWTKELLFYTQDKAEAAEPEYPCCIKLHSVSCNDWKSPEWENVSRFLFILFVSAWLW
jgi:hypothetical protein